MKVLHVFKSYFPPTHGGIEHHINDVVHGLKDRMECAVLTTSDSRRLVVEDDDGVQVVRAPVVGWLSSAAIAPSLARYLRTSGADLVHFHLPNSPVELAYFASRIDTPCVATFHAEIMRWRPIVAAYRPVEQAFLSRMKRIVVSSEALAGSTPALRNHRDRIDVIPFGVDPEEWADRPDAADRLRDSIGGPIVLCMGRLVHYKGAEVAVEAMRNVDATLLVVGDGGRRQAIESLVTRLGLEDKVRMIGEVPNADRAVYYHAADVAVLPATSRGETFGISAVEAMACGVPVVTTELGTGTSWVNAHGETGIVVPPRNADALAGAIDQLLSDPARRRAMGEAARRRVSELFTKEQMLDAVADVYRRSFDESRAA